MIGGGGISPKGHFTPENVVKFWQNPLHAPGFLGIFAYLWIFSSIGGRGVRTLTGTTLGDVCGWKFNCRKNFAIYRFQIVWEENLLFSHIGSSPVEIQ